jgi:hypothetical protein
MQFGKRVSNFLGERYEFGAVRMTHSQAGMIDPLRDGVDAVAELSGQFAAVEQFVKSPIL